MCAQSKCKKDRGYLFICLLDKQMLNCNDYFLNGYYFSTNQFQLFKKYTQYHITNAKLKYSAHPS